MRKYFETIQEQVDAVLEASRPEGEAIETYQVAIQVLEQGIKEMRSDLELHPFEEKAAEIAHYKYDAPKIYGLLFFFMKLVQIEGARAYSSTEKFLELLRGKLAEAEAYLETHSNFCQYYYQKSTYMDDYLFTRQGEGEWSADEPGAFIAEDFTIGAYRASWMQVYERLRNWVVAEMETVKGSNGEFLHKKPLTCLARPVEVVEVFKGLHLAGWFGETPFKEVVAWIREHLGVKVGNYDVILQEIGMRKSSRTKFLDGVTKGLVDWFDERL